MPGSFTLAVLVADGKTGALLSGAQVQIPARKLAQRSDSVGDVRFRELAAGVVRVTVLHPGYAAMETNAILGLHDSTVVVFLMEATSQSLDTIRVTAPAPPEYLQDFDTRRHMRLGRFLTSVQLDSTKHEALVDAVARKFPGLRAEWDVERIEVRLVRPGFYSVRFGKATCVAQVYIDETPATAMDLAFIPAGDIAGVEYYSNTPPVQYRRAGSQCRRCAPLDETLMPDGRRWYSLGVPLLFSAFAFSAAQSPKEFALAILVADGQTGALLSGASVEIPTRKLAQRSDSAGQVRFAGLPPGLVRVTAVHVGYAPMRTNAVLGLTDSTVVVFLMQSAAHGLDTIRVTAPASQEYLREFEGRRKMGLGRFLTAVQLDSTKHENVADLVARRFTGLRAVWDFTFTEVTLESTRGVTSFKHPCHPQVYIDEKPATGDLLGWLQSGDVAGVEYYSNAPPVQYHRAGSACGVVLIWTTR